MGERVRLSGFVSERSMVMGRVLSGSGLGQFDNKNDARTKKGIALETWGHNLSARAPNFSAMARDFRS